MNFNNEFDVIFSNATLHWVKDHQRLLRRAFKALRKNGLLRFNFAADGNCSHFFKVIRKAIERDNFAAYFKEFVWPWYMPPIDEYRELVEKIGIDVNIWGENADRYFPDTDALIGWIDQPSLVPFLVYVEDKYKSSFRDFVIEEMIKETKQDDGRCFETFRRINLLAKK
jgi:trans-aconitate methyltransferase